MELPSSRPSEHSLDYSNRIKPDKTNAQAMSQDACSMPIQAMSGSVALRHMQGIDLLRRHSRQSEKIADVKKVRTMSQLLDASAKGVYTISATPFTDIGDIDWPSVDSLVEFYLQCGVQGLTVLGMMGEAQKLSDEESAEFTRHFLRRGLPRLEEAHADTQSLRRRHAAIY